MKEINEIAFNIANDIDNFSDSMYRKYVTPNFYDDVEKGRTYLCKRTAIGDLLECEEVGGE